MKRNAAYKNAPVKMGGMPLSRGIPFEQMN